MRHSFVIAAAALALMAGQAQAAYVINAVETGGDVVLTGSGSINLGATSFFASGGETSAVRPLVGSVVVGSGLASVFSVALSGPSSFGPQGSTIATFASGLPVGINLGLQRLGVPQLYGSGADLGTSTATFTGATFGSLGMTPGTYVWSWGDAGRDTFDTFTLNIIAEPTGVPAPAALSLLGVGLAGLLAARRRS